MPDTISSCDKIYVVRKHYPEHRDDDQGTYSEEEADELKQKYIAEGYVNADFDSYTHPEFLQMSVQRTGLDDLHKFDQYILDKYQCPIHGEIRIRNTHEKTLIVSKLDDETEQFEIKVTFEELSRWHFLNSAWQNRDNIEWFKQFHF